MEILQHLYKTIRVLGDWIDEVDGYLNGKILLETDSESFKKLLCTTVVASPDVGLPFFLHNSQVFQQREILLHVVQKLRRRNEMNVLTLGFSMASDDIGAQVSGTHNIEYLYPNSCFNRLQYPVWSKLLARIGDSRMEYLLEKTSLFIAVPDSCFVQLTGKPVYELWPMYTGKFLSLPISDEKKQLKRSRKSQGRSNCNRKMQRIPEKYVGTFENNDNLEASGNHILISMEISKDPSTNMETVEGPSTNIEASEGHSTNREGSKDLFPNGKESRDPRMNCEVSGGHSSSKDTLVGQTTGRIDVSKGNKSRRKRRKEKETSLEFTPYEYHTFITRIRMLYAKSLIERLSKTFILQSVPASEEGALALYRHIYEHNKSIKAPNIDIAWKFTEHSSDTSLVNESSCCSGPDHFEIMEIDELNNNHSSFFNTQCHDRSFMKVGSQVNRSGDFNLINKHYSERNKSDACLHSDNSSITRNRVMVEQKEFSACQSKGFDFSESTCMNSDQHSLTDPNRSSSVVLGKYCATNIKENKLRQGQDERSFTDNEFTVLKDPSVVKRNNVLHVENQFSSTPVESSHYQSVDTNSSETKSSLSTFNIMPPSEISMSGKRKRTKSTEDRINEAKRVCLDMRQNSATDEFSDKNKLNACAGETIIETNMGIEGSVQITSTCHLIRKPTISMSDPKTNAQVRENRGCHSLDKTSSSANNIETTIEVPYMMSMCSLLHQMLKKHRTCPYRSLLEYYCPVKTQNRKCHFFQRGQKQFREINLLGTFSVREDLNKAVPHRQVYLFLRRVCLYIVPEQLFGDNFNRNIFCKNIKKIVSLNKYDKICIGQVLTGVKVKCIKWLKCVKSNSLKQHVMALLWYWMVTELVIPIIKTFFYVTDTTQHVNCLFYYRKSTWHKLHQHAVSDLVKRNILKRVSKNKVEQLMKQRQSLGISSLRFLPKPKGLRPIVNLGAQQRDFGLRSLSINKQLQNLLQVLSLVKKSHPQIVGAAKFGLDEVYKTWKEYAVKQNQPLYFVKTDIRHCYDEILQHKLFSIVKKLFSNPDIVSDDFVVRRYVKLVNEGGIIKRKFLRKAFQLGDFKPDFIGFITQKNQEDNSHNAIFVDQVVSQQETREQLLKLLHCHIFHNLIKIGQTCYEQSKGISQGSVISTLLCNIYYGDMEKLFPVEKGELMMRIVDDALFVTPFKDRAIAYCLQMLNGVPEYNLNINKNKVVTNFDVTGLMDGLHVMQDTDWLPWCGILLNMKTLEASINLSFYFSCSLKHSMTFDSANQAGQTMKRKLFRSLRLKCHPFYFDSQLNSMNVVVINIYKIFLLAASKFMEYVRHLPKRDNCKFFTDIIFALGHYFDLLYRKTRKNMKFKEMGRCLLPSQVQWLCYNAFSVKLNQSRSQFKPVVTSLRKSQAKLCSKLENEKYSTAFLLTVCGKTLPAEFNGIR